MTIQFNNIDSFHKFIYSTPCEKGFSVTFNWQGRKFRHRESNIQFTLNDLIRNLQNCSKNAPHDELTSRRIRQIVHAIKTLDRFGKEQEKTISCFLKIALSFRRFFGNLGLSRTNILNEIKYNYRMNVMVEPRVKKFSRRANRNVKVQQKISLDAKEKVKPRKKSKNLLSNSDPIFVVLSLSYSLSKDFSNLNEEIYPLFFTEQGEILNAYDQESKKDSEFCYAIFNTVRNKLGTNQKIQEILGDKFKNYLDLNKWETPLSESSFLKFIDLDLDLYSELFNKLEDTSYFPFFLCQLYFYLSLGPILLMTPYDKIKGLENEKKHLILEYINKSEKLKDEQKKILLRLPDLADINRKVCEVNKDLATYHMLEKLYSEISDIANLSIEKSVRIIDDFKATEQKWDDYIKIREEVYKNHLSKIAELKNNHSNLKEYFTHLEQLKMIPEERLIRIINKLNPDHLLFLCKWLQKIGYTLEFIQKNIIFNDEEHKKKFEALLKYMEMEKQSSKFSNKSDKNVPQN